MIVIFAVLAALIAVLALPMLFRPTSGAGLRFGAWTFRPSPFGWLALMLAAVLISIALWRFFPGFIFLPVIIPFFWTWRRKPRESRRGDDTPASRLELQ